MLTQSIILSIVLSIIIITFITLIIIDAIIVYKLKIKEKETDGILQKYENIIRDSSLSLVHWKNNQEIYKKYNKYISYKNSIWVYNIKTEKKTEKKY